MSGETVVVEGVEPPAITECEDRHSVQFSLPRVVAAHTREEVGEEGCDAPSVSPVHGVDAFQWNCVVELELIGSG